MTREERKEIAIKNANAMPQKAGRADYLKHLKGQTLTRNQAIRAKCYECVGGEDTKPCNISSCPLTQFSQWNNREEANDDNE
jgi:hypothetical protein